MPCVEKVLGGSSSRSEMSLEARYPNGTVRNSTRVESSKLACCASWKGKATSLEHRREKSISRKKAKNAEDMKRLKSPKNVMEGTGVIEHHCKRRR
jgi:hypothetical protein